MITGFYCPDERGVFVKRIPSPVQEDESFEHGRLANLAKLAKHEAEQQALRDAIEETRQRIQKACEAKA